MPKQKPMAAEIEALRQWYAALNRGDVAATLKIFDAKIEREEFLGLPMAGTYRGLAAVKEHIQNARATWAEGACEPQRFIASGDKVVVISHVRVRLKSEKEWHEGEVADVFTFRNGKAIHYRTFAEEKQALEWADLKGPRPS